MTTISNKAVKKLEGNQVAIGMLMVVFNKHSKTIERWIENKDVRLTTPQAVDVVKSVTGLSEDEILEQKPEKSAA